MSVNTVVPCLHNPRIGTEIGNIKLVPGMGPSYNPGATKDPCKT